MVVKKKVKFTKAVKVGKGGENAGGIPNKKLKCFMRKLPPAKGGGMYRTCAVPEKNKQPKKQVRGKPRGQGKGGERVYKTDADRKKAQSGAGKKARAEKSGNMTATKADGTVKVLKMKNKPKKPRTEAQKEATRKLVALNKAKKAKKEEPAPKKRYVFKKK
jgi:hypothetical protein